jgi:hypothetical protein
VNYIYFYQREDRAFSTEVYHDNHHDATDCVELDESAIAPGWSIISHV